jgi:hypothetical protein
MPEELSKIPLYAISHDSASNLLACRNPESGGWKIIFTPHDKKPAYGCFFLIGSELKIISPLPQTYRFWECSGCVIHYTIMNLFCSNSYGQVLTPFGSSALNYQPAIFSGHSYQKTVSALT